MTMTSPEPDEPERPCFVPDEDDPHERELPMSPTLCWDDGDIPASSEVPSPLVGPAQTAADADLWAFKRQRQRDDMAAGARGDVTQDDLSWFSGGKARNLRLIDSPY